MSLKTLLPQKAEQNSKAVLHRNKAPNELASISWTNNFTFRKDTSKCAWIFLFASSMKADKAATPSRYSFFILSNSSARAYCESTENRYKNIEVRKSQQNIKHRRDKSLNSIQHKSIAFFYEICVFLFRQKIEWVIYKSLFKFKN